MNKLLLLLNELVTVEASVLNMARASKCTRLAGGAWGTAGLFGVALTAWVFLL